MKSYDKIRFSQSNYKLMWMRAKKLNGTASPENCTFYYPMIAKSETRTVILHVTQIQLFFEKHFH